MSDYRKVITKIGWLEVLISIQSNLELEKLGLTQTSLTILSLEPIVRPVVIPLVINEPRIISLKPGLYTITARLGGILSSTTEVAIKTGTTEKINFHFGAENE